MTLRLDKELITEELIQWIHDDRSEEKQPKIEVSSDSRLLDEQIFDSMKVLQFITWLEQRYGVHIGVEQMTAEFFSTPKVVAERVRALMMPKQP